MPGRERLLASLVELSGRSSGRTRANVIDTTLSLALLLTEADGAVLVLGGARAFERSVLRRGQGKPDELSEVYRPAPFERSLPRASQPRPIIPLYTGSRDTSNPPYPLSSVGVGPASGRPTTK